MKPAILALSLAVAVGCSKPHEEDVAPHSVELAPAPGDGGEQLSSDQPMSSARLLNILRHKRSDTVSSSFVDETSGEEVYYPIKGLDDGPVHRLFLQSQKVDIATICSSSLCRDLKLLFIHEVSDRVLTEEDLDHLASLKSLKSLTILFRRDRPPLSAAMVAALSRIENLQHVRLMRAVIPDSSLAGLVKCQFLVDLELHSCVLGTRSAEYIGALRSLRTLSLAGATGIENSVHALGQLDSLTYLNLDYTGLSDEHLAGIVGASRIETLDLSRTNVSDAGIKTISQLVSLRELRLNDLPITGATLGQLRTIPNLQKLELMDSTLSPDGWSTLASLQSIRSLDLGRSNATDDCVRLFVEHPALEEIYLRGTAVTDACLHDLEKIKRLHLSDLEGTRCTPEALRKHFLRLIDR